MVPLQPRSASTDEPAPFEIVRGSGSGEGFAEALADKWWKPDKQCQPEMVTGRCAMFIVDELGALLEKARRGQAGNMIEFLISCFDAKSVWSHRTRSGPDARPLTMTESFGVLLAATTEEWLGKAMTLSQVHAGFTNRLLWFAGENQYTFSIRPEIPQTKIEELQQSVAAVLRWACGKRLVLSDDARDLHHQWYLYHLARVHESSTAAAATTRSDTLALRIGMLLAVAEYKEVLAVEHIQAAWEIVECSNHTICGIVERLQEDGPREAEARVLGAIQRQIEQSGSLFTRRDIQQRIKGKTGMDAVTFTRVFKSLIDSGQIAEDAKRKNSFRVVA